MKQEKGYGVLSFPLTRKKDSGVYLFCTLCRLRLVSTANCEHSLFTSVSIRWFYIYSEQLHRIESDRTDYVFIDVDNVMIFMKHVLSTFETPRKKNIY